MVVDSSALLALLLGEPESAAIARAIAADARRLASAFTILEAAVVVETKKGESGGRELDLLLHRAQIDVMIMDAGQVELARSAYRKYGRGRHPTSVTAAPTPSRGSPGSLSCSRETTLRRRTSRGS